MMAYAWQVQPLNSIFIANIKKANEKIEMSEAVLATSSTPGFTSNVLMTWRMKKMQYKNQRMACQSEE